MKQLMMTLAAGLVAGVGRAGSALAQRTATRLTSMRGSISL
ncbi:MAG: hypothetical protein OXC72_01130 [Roseovarius sp.]|nr:hypothetical protein [Roseovarius sp.]MCY4290349.1 hypothetical protein [Roseovarius sp.]